MKGLIQADAFLEGLAVPAPPGADRAARSPGGPAQHQGGGAPLTVEGEGRHQGREACPEGVGAGSGGAGLPSTRRC